MNAYEPLTKAEFRKVLPAGVRKNVNDRVINNVNDALASDPGIGESFRDNIIGYTSVMKDGRFKIESYLKAVRYVSYKLMGEDNVGAFKKAFPERYQRYIDENLPAIHIRAHISGYNKTKLVNLIFAQTLIPVHVYNADMYQEALNVQADLMRNAKSEKVRTDAANSILGQLKMPEVTKIELDIGIKEDPAIEELRATTMELVAQQRQAILAGVKSTKQIAHSKIIREDSVIEGELVETIDVKE